MKIPRMTEFRNTGAGLYLKFSNDRTATMDPVVQLALGLVTVLLSGVVSGYVTYQLNTRRDARQLRRQKLEAAYEAFNGFTTSLISHWLPYMAVMENSLEYNQALDITIKGDKPKSNDLRTLEMLIAIYFPAFQRHLDELIKTRDLAGQILREHKEMYREVGPHDASEQYTGMTQVVAMLREVESNFRESARHEAKLLNRRIPGADQSRQLGG